jgi:hypothetical protein
VTAEAKRARTARGVPEASRFAGFLSLLGVLAAAPTAGATPPSWDSLPIAHLPLAATQDGPTAIPASTPLPEDLRLFSAPNAAVIAVPRDIGASPQLTSLTEANRAELRTEPGRSACVSFGNQVGAFRQSMLYVYRDGTKTPVRVETLQERDGGAVLHVADFWVDAKTKAAVAAQPPVDVPLARVTGPNEPAVYAYRVESPAPSQPAAASSEKANPATRPAAGAKPAAPTSTVVLVMGSSQRSNFRASSGRVLTSQCPIAFGEIDLQAGGGTVVGELTRRLMIEETLPSTAPAGAVPSRMPFDRNLSVTASVSQTSADPVPLLSIRTRWTTEMPAKFVEQRL